MENRISLASTITPTGQEMANARSDIASEKKKELLASGKWSTYISRAQQEQKTFYSVQNNMEKCPVSPKQIALALIQGEISEDKARMKVQQDIARRLDKKAVLTRNFRDMLTQTLSTFYPAIDERKGWRKQLDRDCSILAETLSFNLGYEAMENDKAFASAAKCILALSEIDSLSRKPISNRKLVITAIFDAVFNNTPITLFNFECFDIIYDPEEDLYQLGIAESDLSGYKLFRPKYTNPERAILSALESLNIPVKLIKLIPDEELEYVYEILRSDSRQAQLPCFFEALAQQVQVVFPGFDVQIIPCSQITNESYDQIFETVMESFTECASPYVRQSVFDADFAFRQEKNAEQLGLPPDYQRDLLYTQRNFALYAAELACIREVLGTNAVFLINEPDLTVVRFNTLSALCPTQPKLPVISIF